jgi:predicted transposase YbfD/YdcC
LPHIRLLNSDSVTVDSDIVTGRSDTAAKSVTLISESPVTPSEPAVTPFRNQRSRCVGIRTLREFFAEADAGGFGALPVSRHAMIEKDHGRIETRSAQWVSGLDWLDREIRQHWPKLAGVGMVERTRDINGKISTERAFYIDSKGIGDAETFAKAARSHWGVENRLHWVLDVTFREDDCRVRKGHAPQNLSALRKFALSLLRQDKQYSKRSLRGRRKTADRLPDYRASLLGLVPLG